MNGVDPAVESQKRRSRMKIVLWILQALLALFFLAAGFPKAFQPLDVVGQSISWVPDVPPALVRFIGVSELLGAVGLILPALTRIQPRVTVFAGLGLAVVMASASIFHIARGELFAIPMTMIVCALAAFVAYGRWKLEPVSSRS